MSVTDIRFPHLRAMLELSPDSRKLRVAMRRYVVQLTCALEELRAPADLHAPCARRPRCASLAIPAQRALGHAVRADRVGPRLQVLLDAHVHARGKYVAHSPQAM